MAATKRYRNRHIEIEQITIGGYHATVATTTLWLDRESKLYWAEYGGEKIEDKDPDEVKRRITENMRAANDVTWQTCIEISWQEEGMSSIFGIGERRSYAVRDAGVGSMQFSYKRFLWAPFPDGRIRVIEHTDCEPRHYLVNARLISERVWKPDSKPGAREFGEFNPPCYGADWQGNKDAKVFLPYSEEVWTGLTLLVEKTRELSARLATLLGTTDGHAKLAAAAMPFALPDSQKGKV